MRLMGCPFDFRGPALALLVLTAAGCASDAPPTASRDAAPDRRARALDLVVEPTSDEAKLAAMDDAALSAAIRAGEREVNELTGQLLFRATDSNSDDLSQDRAYRALLLKTKTAEERLGRLEMERSRRAAEKNRGSSPG